MENLTFNELPKAITQLCEDMAFVKRHLLEKNAEPQPETDELLTVQDTAKFLRLSVPSIYGLISKGEIPVMKRSKRCYFSKNELINYLKAGRKKKTVTEIAAEAEQYVNNRKKRNRRGE